ncbi:hypothetical protein Q5741_18835 [Paenibacillus sp. JX-17]|uniref:Uncharacterized protein n=1 Tax=Paenibacillus lacisoli TaxID=3064525 RepID=A0ABT9CGT9_9BACL|nr:hypothetical protein [Paenibacillus sp. JX-17]MDO7908460.1 hypothetical protein [Paenibacillus sp. JX-17]
MNNLTEEPVRMKSMMGNRIWRLYNSDRAAFKEETLRYFSRGYPGWKVVRIDYPLVYLEDERNKQK